jgi:hypothetical protein
VSPRTLELAQQAGLKKDHGSDREYMGDFDWRAFAELLVRECAGEVLCQLYDYDPSSNEQFNLGHEAGLKLAVSKIKEHFGVE